jgi:hypothetical protein
MKGDRERAGSRDRRQITQYTRTIRERKAKMWDVALACCDNIPRRREKSI